MDKKEREKWERLKRGEKPDTELNSTWIPPKSENDLDASNKERLEQYKNAYINVLKTMNNQFGTDVKLLGITNNGNGSFTITTRGLADDMAKFKRNSETFNKLLNNQLQQKSDTQNPKQNIAGLQNNSPNQTQLNNTYKPPTPFKITPPKPTDTNR